MVLKTESKIGRLKWRLGTNKSGSYQKPKIREKASLTKTRRSNREN